MTAFGKIKNTETIRSKKSYLKYLAGLLLFGSNGVVASYIDLSGYEIVLLRSVLGIALLLVLFFITGHRFTALRHKKDLMFIALSGIAMAADWLLLLFFRDRRSPCAVRSDMRVSGAVVLGAVVCTDSA